MPTWITDLLNAIGTLLSAVCALVAVLLSFYVHRQTERRLGPSERPHFRFNGATIDATICKATPTLADVVVEFRFQNYGRHPATAVTAKIAEGWADEMTGFVHKNQMDMFADIAPEALVLWHTKRQEPVKPVDGELTPDKTQPARTRTLVVYIRLEYSDAWDDSGDTFVDEFHFVQPPFQPPTVAPYAVGEAIQGRVAKIYPG